MLSDRFFASATKVHSKPIEFTDGTIETVFFRELAWQEWFDYQDDMTNADREVRKAAICRLVAQAVCEPDGRPSFDFETAKRINVEPLNNLLGAILEIHGRDQTKKKPQLPAPSSGSGTPSPSPSEAAA